MISPTHMAESFARNVQIIKMQTAGLSHAESLTQLPFRGNCMNWIVGHIANSRNSVLELLGATPALDPERATRYARDSEPITGDGPGVLPLEELIATLEHSQVQLNELLMAITLEELSRQVALFGGRARSVGEWLLFFFFHETYHTGQTEILRQAAGKDDKVI